jgi:hypothetical protein
MKRGTYEFERIAEQLNLRLAKLREHRARFLAALGRNGEGPNVTRLCGSSSRLVLAAPPIRSVKGGPANVAGATVTAARRRS